MFTQSLVIWPLALTLTVQLAVSILANGPIEVTGLLDSLKAWSLTIVTGIVSLIFIWRLIGHVKDSPIEWKAVVGDIAGIAFMAAVAFNTSALIDYVRNNITFNSR